MDEEVRRVCHREMIEDAFGHGHPDKSTWIADLQLPLERLDHNQAVEPGATMAGTITRARPALSGVGASGMAWVVLGIAQEQSVSAGMGARWNGQWSRNRGFSVGFPAVDAEIAKLGARSRRDGEPVR